MLNGTQPFGTIFQVIFVMPSGYVYVVAVGFMIHFMI